VYVDPQLESAYCAKYRGGLKQDSRLWRARVPRQASDIAPEWTLLELHAQYIQFVTGFMHTTWGHRTVKALQWED
jgi:hypothetical protein